VVRTGLNIVDARDCAQGHLLAAAKGRVGERYILGGENLELEQLARMAMEAGGVSRPLPVVPWTLAYVAALVDEGIWSRLTLTPPRAPLSGVKLARQFMWFSSAKAQRELGYSARPAREAIEAAVAWWREQGMLSRGDRKGPSLRSG
jgi:dihydroflavonol-4-reductase